MKPLLDEWPDLYRGNLAWLPERTVLLTKHGSHAYGLNIETSDLDVKGVAIPPKPYVAGFLNRFEQAESHEPDLTIYEVRKFFHLASNGNPNIIEVLWTDSSDYLQVMEPGEILLANRQLFLSRKVKHTFSGYAMSQLHRLKNHHSWLTKGSLVKPRREDFGLSPAQEMTHAQRDQMGAAMAMAMREVVTWDDLSWTEMSEPDKIGLKNRIAEYLARMVVTKQDVFIASARSVGMDDNMLLLLLREKTYAAAVQEYQSWIKWTRDRNPQRAEMEAKYGYDTKHAMHLVRLMRMCREMLTTGKVVVRRPDREELLSIRNGAWPYEQLVEFADREDKALSEAMVSSPLPKEPAREQLDALCTEMVTTYM